ncbi:MAG: hypothetical protein ACK553_00550 [Planctomycetota bacterium]|jgi:hypothetical protein
MKSSYLRVAALLFIGAGGFRWAFRTFAASSIFAFAALTLGGYSNHLAFGAFAVLAFAASSVLALAASFVLAFAAIRFGNGSNNLAHAAFGIFAFAAGGSLGSDGNRLAFTARALGSYGFAFAARGLGSYGFALAGAYAATILAAAFARAGLARANARLHAAGSIDTTRTAIARRHCRQCGSRVFRNVEAGQAGGTCNGSYRTDQSNQRKNI